tara:strand:+ start:175 stop:399 length:225 start_codon:yes stop_codon:yes gene_type:complete
MKIPKKILEKFIELAEGDHSLSKFNKKTRRWEKVPFDPNNEEHVKIKEMHLAEVEIMCVIEGMRMGVDMSRDLD